MDSQTLPGRDEIRENIMSLMIEYGPDGHCDGSDEITDYVMELLDLMAKTCGARR